MQAKALLLASIALVGSESHAQLPPFSGVPAPNSQKEVMPGLPGQSPYRQVVAADLDGNLDNEIIYVVDTGIVVCMNVATSTSCFRVDIPCNDVVARSLPSGKDELVLACSAGLVILNFTFDFPGEVITWTQRGLSDTAVQGLRTLTSCTLTSQGTQDLIAVGSDGQSLVAILEDPVATCGYSVYTPFSPTTTGTAWDVVAINRSGAGAVEVGAITSHGLEFFNASGTNTQTYAQTDTIGAICRFVGTGGEGIAWARRDINGDAELVLATSIGISSPVTLGSFTVVAMASGDLTFDGNSDLALSTSDASKLLVIEYLNGSFDLSGLRTLSNGNASSSNNVASPLIADLNGDEHFDVALADLSTQDVYIHYNDGSDDYYEQFPPVEYLDFAIEANVTWNFGYEIPHHITTPEDVTHLQVRVYHQFPNAIVPPTSEDPGNPDGWSPPQHVVPVPEGPYYASTDVYYPYITFPYAAQHDPDGDYVTFVEGRFVVMDGSEVVKKYPPVFVAFCEQDNQAAIAYVLDYWAGYPVTFTNVGSGTKTGGQGGTPPSGGGGGGGG